MGHVLCCWELGAGYGHLYRLLPVAQALTQAGHQVTLVSKASERARPVFESGGIRIFPAPVLRPPVRPWPLSLTYSQNLLKNGYWHSPTLRQRLRAWRAIFETHQPDLVVAEHAPTALLAARLAGLPRGVTGTGFTLPPRQSPLPGIQPWFSLPEPHLRRIERAFLESLNPALESLGGQALTAAAQIFDQAEAFLCTWPELDHYALRGPADYLGPILYSPADHPPVWPQAEGARIFLYMHARNRLLRPLLSLLKELPVSVLAFLPDMPPGEARAWAGGNLRLAAQPVNLAAAARECQLMISQGGANAGTYMLLHGVPLLILPLALEQMLWAYRLSQQGLAATVNYFSKAPDLRAKLRRVLETDEWSSRAEAFARQYASYDPQRTLQSIARKCNQLMSL